MKRRAQLAALLVATAGLLVAPSGVATSVAQAAPDRTAFIQVSKITPTSVTARIRCPYDPNPDGTQNFFLTATRADGVNTTYFGDVAALCDSTAHKVTIPISDDDVLLRPGDRVEYYASIPGDSGEVNAWGSTRIRR